jgi:hypothetical protein
VLVAVAVCVRPPALSRRQTCPVERAPRRTRSRGMPAADCRLRAAGLTAQIVECQGLALSRHFFLHITLPCYDAHPLASTHPFRGLETSDLTATSPLGFWAGWGGGCPRRERGWANVHKCCPPFLLCGLVCVP